MSEKATCESSGCGCAVDVPECTNSVACSTGTNPCTKSIPNAPYIIGTNHSAVGPVPRVSTSLTAKDRLGAWKVRWGIGRMNYKVDPGLYCTGNPDENSPVLVTSNYKLTFDVLRKQLVGLNLWILVLDTKGVNVWCAAGKGTFGTCELVHRMEATKLGDIVKHRTVIVPQLGATGVSAHEVAKRSGFHVVYGPVRACDVKAFLEAGMKATKEMRTVKFTLADRVVLTPVEMVHYAKPLALLFGVLFILNAVGLSSFGLFELVGFTGAVLTGCLLTPILLPWIPGRAFSLKGALLGALWGVALILLSGGFVGLGILKDVSCLLLLPAISAYVAMNFTGCSTYTSLSGVQKEMRIAIPVQLGASIIGMILLLIDTILKTVR